MIPFVYCLLSISWTQKYIFAKKTSALRFFLEVYDNPSQNLPELVFFAISYLIFQEFLKTLEKTVYMRLEKKVKSYIDKCHQ